MSRFYATIEKASCRKQLTRCGHSSLTTTTRGWTIGCAAHIQPAEGGTDTLRIDIDRGSHDKRPRWSIIVTETTTGALKIDLGDGKIIQCS